MSQKKENIMEPIVSEPDLGASYSAAIIIIGVEILSGRTQDTNTSWLAEKMTERGILLGEVRIVPDEKDSIINAVHDLKDNFDFIFTTGGIGPTHDDITSQTIAEAFDIELEQNEDAFKMLEEFYGLADLTPARVKMSMIPKGAKLIPNPVSAAPGFNIKNVYVMAGIPRIMQAMFDHVIETIESGEPILSHTVTCNLQESVIAEDLEDLQRQYLNVIFGSYPHYRGGTCGLSLVLRSTNQEDLMTSTDALVALIEKHGDKPRAISFGTKPSTLK